MKIIISPAKKLTNEIVNISKPTSVQFLTEAKYLINELKKLSVKDIKELMGLSDSLAQLNHHRYQEWDLQSKLVNPAIFMFQGDVYKGLSVDDLSDNDLDFAQQNLRIISGLYGILRPFDIVFPYRLEMGTKMLTKEGRSLYEFWGDKLNKYMSLQMENDEVLINLASNEYSKALKLDLLKNQVITPVFKEFKNGKLKVISIYAKKARGIMSRFIIKNKISSPDELVSFNEEGYVFSNQENGEMLFCR